MLEKFFQIIGDLRVLKGQEIIVAWLTFQERYRYESERASEIQKAKELDDAIRASEK